VMERERKAYPRFGKEYIHWDGSANNILATVRSEESGYRWKRALEAFNLSGTERILELGAGRCWASYLFARFGCQAIAVDFNADDVTGLGAGTTLCRSADTHFERVAAEISHMPFQDLSFDAIFCNAVLHHLINLEKVMRETYRVLRAGGIFVATCEHKLGILESDEAFRSKQASVQYGANEHSLSYRKYLAVLKTAGFCAEVTFDGKYEEDMVSGRFDLSSPKGKIALALLSCLGKERLRKLIHLYPIKRLLMEVVGLDVMIVGRKSGTRTLQEK